MLEDYRQAAGHLNEAAFALETASVSITGAGYWFTRESARLIEQTNSLYVAINRVRDRLREVPCDDY